MDIFQKKMENIAALWKTVWQVLKKVKVELPHAPAAPTPDTRPQRTENTGKEPGPPAMRRSLFLTSKERTPRPPRPWPLNPLPKHICPK